MRLLFTRPIRGWAKNIIYPHTSLKTVVYSCASITLDLLLSARFQINVNRIRGSIQLNTNKNKIYIL